MKVPLLDLNAQYAPVMDDIRSEMEKVFASHAYKLGPQVKEFEEEMQKFCEVKHAVGCASGTDALVLALLALSIGDGDEVITTPFTFFATAGTIHRVGARPVFVDVKSDTFNIDPDKIEVAITPKTKAIIAVHLFGQPAEMDKIMAIAKKHNLKVIEDNAQGIGAKFDGKTAGTIGDIGTLSFFPSKNLGAMGDGGMCLTNDAELADRLFQLREHGENPQYYHKWVGLNSRLDTIQAAVLLVKLRYLPAWSEARRKNAAYYFQNMQNIPQIKLPVVHKKAESIFNQFTLVAEKRDELLKYLRSNDIGCAIYYPLPLHQQECFSYLNYKKSDFPISEQLAESVISIPVFSEITKEQQDYVIEEIRNFYK
ncbi:MAG: DegT/DnrJ/EryC1/StrS family aminotransferase [Candidatus Cloacimonadales bacterium]|nr:DegT/DnrJ/EryC1/StrS family aminotransferase [Candidatus Cloacimonadales bacterium]